MIDGLAKHKNSFLTRLQGYYKKKDFAKISIKDITDQADVNRSTFYIHFEDKYDLLNKYLAFQTLDFSSYAVQIHANIPQKKESKN